MLLDWAWNIILSQKTHLGDGFRSRNRFLGAYMWCCSECFQFPILGSVFCRQCPDPGLPLLGWNSSATVLGSPTGPQNHTNPELRSPLSLLQFPLSTKSWFAAGPASPGTCLADLFMFQRAAAALLWKTFPLSFSWSSHSMKNLCKALKNFSRQSFRNEVAIWFFFALRCFLFSSKIIRFFLTAISHNGNKY